MSKLYQIKLFKIMFENERLLHCYWGTLKRKQVWTVVVLGNEWFNLW